ncbi:MAG: hypothetical protein JWP06_361 [Candidatus Saccharibacteria bacterium]|nr:hypothetical protein [Candidatus Saccharibacteria bacterium]
MNVKYIVHSLLLVDDNTYMMMKMPRFNIFGHRHINVSKRIPLRVALTLAAIGVVYGDIGTSPLYVINEAFFGMGHLAVTRPHVLGIVSMIIWLLTIVVSIEYIFVVLRASYQGEGGVFALHELIAGIKSKRKPLLLLLVFAATLLLGDGMITPAISVLSAVEGLKVVTHVFSPYVVYITAAILIGLFLVQRRGTAKVGMLFGPVMVVWFVAIAGLGLHQVIQTPDILNALNPVFAFQFAVQIGFHNFLLAVGAVTLAVTGAESLYADLGHFGKRPIRQGWFYVAFWALGLNYLGQGAYLLSGQSINGDNVFFSLIPHLAVSPAVAHLFPAWIADHLAYAPLYTMVVLATGAAVIASQALITGAFTLASQAMALGMAPRLNIIHTNHQHEGQIYVPAINWLLMAGCLVLVFVFRSSSNLAAAYGLAVTGVMMATSASMYQVARHKWNWQTFPATLIFRAFLAIDLTLFTANLLKFFTGGYVPVIVALSLFACVLTWRWGRDFVHTSYAAYTSYATSKDIAWLADLKRRLSKKSVLFDRARRITETDRASVFLVSQPVTSITSQLPIIIRIYMKRHGSLPKHIVMLTILQEKKPFVSERDRIEVIDFGYNILAVKAHFGFMQVPNGLEVLKDLKKLGHMGDEIHRCSVEVAEEELFVGKNARFVDKIRVGVYQFFARISPPAYHYFRFDTKPGLSKTVVPILLGKNGWRIDIPEYALESEEERIDPDTRLKTDLRFVRTGKQPEISV